MKTKLLALVLVLVMCLSLSTALCGCNSDKANDSTANQVEIQKATEDPLWKTATYTENVTLGEGATTIEVEVKANDKAITVTVNTDAENLESALLENELVEGEEGAYGLYIKKVNGILADYDVDGAYWAMYKEGEYLTTGVNEAVITSGDHFELVYTK